MGTNPKKPWAILGSRGDKKAPAGKEADQETDAPVGPPPQFSNTLAPYHHGDPIPTPEAVEKDTDTMWALFSDLSASENRGFADTVPPTQSMRLPPEDRGYAATVPASLEELTGDVGHPKTLPPKELSMGEVLVEARRNNRVCPQPARWRQLYEMLPDKQRSGAGWQPTPPLVDAAWKETPSIPKRMCFREHLEWAAAHGCLPEVYAFMRSLREEEWHHMGD